MTDNFARALSEGYFCENPLTTVSNLVILIVGLTVFRKVLRIRKKNLLNYLVVFSIFTIGVGSTLWHSTGIRWTGWVDMGGIYLLIVLYLILIVYKLTNSYLYTPLGVLFLIPLQLYFFFNVSYSIFNLPINHLINAVIFIFLSFGFINKFPNLTGKVIIALTIYIVAVGVRFFDKLICEAGLLGTHWIWHVLASIAIYFSSDLLLITDNW